MNKLGFMYRRKDNFQWRNVKPLVSYKIARALGANADMTQHLNNPIMIFGCARSGTTTLKEVLSGHQRIVPVPFEANELWHPALYPWRSTEIESPPIWGDPFVFTDNSNKHRLEADIQKLRSAFGAYNYLQPSSTVLLKSAMVAFMIPEMLQILPNMKLVHLHRDGRAVALSLAKKQWIEANKYEDIHRSRGYWVSFDELLERMAHHWVEHIDEIERRDEQMGLTQKGTMLTVNYEGFCSSPKKTAEEIVKFTGISTDGFDIERYAEVKETNYKYSNELSEAQLDAITSIMAPTLQKLGYKV
ncbi:MAG: hypothetical protein ACI9EQ_001062 [Bacteroidia bacterium]|jgi:hypothetical protein